MEVGGGEGLRGADLLVQPVRSCSRLQICVDPASSAATLLLLLLLQIRLAVRKRPAVSLKPLKNPSAAAAAASRAVMSSQRGDEVTRRCSFGARLMRHRSHLADRWAGPFPDETAGINTAHHQRFVIALIGHQSGRDERGGKKKKKQPEKCSRTFEFTFL